MQPDRLHRVRGAAWVVAAAWREQGAYEEAIRAQQTNQRPLDCRVNGDVHGFLLNFSQRSSAARRTWVISIGLPSPRRVTTMTMSQLGRLPRARRKDSRIRRLALLRSIARRSTLRGATTPSRETHILFLAAMRRNGPLRRRCRGLLKTRSNSGLRVRRAPRGKLWSAADRTSTASPFSVNVHDRAASSRRAARTPEPSPLRVRRVCPCPVYHPVHLAAYAASPTAR